MTMICLGCTAVQGEVDWAWRVSNRCYQESRQKTDPHPPAMKHLFKIACSPRLMALVCAGCGLRFFDDSILAIREWLSEAVNSSANEINSCRQERIMCPPALVLGKSLQTDPPGFCVPAHPASLQGSHSLTGTRRAGRWRLCFFNCPWRNWVKSLHTVMLGEVRRGIQLQTRTVCFCVETSGRSLSSWEVGIGCFYKTQ